jgi:Ser/Thr protein kinase RdoA (MazF antagonist)
VEDLGDVSGAELVIFGSSSAVAIAELLERYLRRRLGLGISEVLFRAGRIDSVWGVRTDDGSEVVVKAHRPPVDLTARRAAVAAQRLLGEAGFPCPTPLSGPDVIGELVLSAEAMLLEGSPGDARDPRTRVALVTGLAEHIELLRAHPGLTSVAGRGPAWCRYQDGPWPTPHDSIFDFTRTPGGFEWLDHFAQQAADDLNAARGSRETVVGHADWYGGNLRFAGDRLVAAFDWDLVAEVEPVVVGLNAGAYADTGTPAGATTPGDVAAFLIEYDRARPALFDPAEQRLAAAAASWTVAYNARCRLSTLSPDIADATSLEMVRKNQDQFLQLTW